AGGWRKPRIVIAGVRMLYEICLRPRFFLASTADERLEILAHELWHVSPLFDGTLAEERRHEHAAGGSLERGVEQLLRTWRSAKLDRVELEAILAHRGELELGAWLSRPPTRFAKDAKTRAEYTERDLFRAIVEQR